MHISICIHTPTTPPTARPSISNTITLVSSSIHSKAIPTMVGKSPKEPQESQPYIERMDREIRQLEAEGNLNNIQMAARIISIYLRTYQQIKRDERMKAAKQATKARPGPGDNSKDGNQDPGAGSSAAECPL